METYWRPLMAKSIEQNLNPMIFSSFSSFSKANSGEVTWCVSDIIKKGERDVGRGDGCLSTGFLNPANFRVSEVRSVVRYYMLVVVGCDFSLGRRRYAGRVTKSVGWDFWYGC
ncbi:hypothetical protein KY289_017251 [Solanum tuberosum]|nr:hypothetical protein KY289_017251 [Solanum tuberosum]